MRRKHVRFALIVQKPVDDGGHIINADDLYPLQADNYVAAVEEAESRWNNEIVPKIRRYKNGLLYPHSPRLVQEVSLVYAALQRRWWKLMHRLEGYRLLIPEAKKCLADLLAAHTEGWRHFRTLDLLYSRLRLFDESQHIADSPFLLEFALFFRDMVFEAGASDNAEKCAAAAGFKFRLIMEGHPLKDSPDITIENLVLATKHEELSSDPDTQLMCDIDLAYLGAQNGAFEYYLMEDARENVSLGLNGFHAERCTFFQRLLERGSVYQTARFRAQFEEQTQKNLRAFIEKHKSAS